MPPVARMDRIRIGDPLTTRELSVLHGISRGHTNRRIGRTVGIGEETVAHYVQSLRRKLGARDRAHAAALAYRRGVLVVHARVVTGA